MMLGKVEHRMIFRDDEKAGSFRALAALLPDQSPSTLLNALIEYFRARGLSVIDPSTFLAPYFCGEGVLGSSPVSEAVEADIAFGWPRAKTLADLDIGQTLVVKGRAVVAVEGMEGTDETIRRAAALAGDGIVVLKAGRTRQDMRVDVPMVGPETVRILAEARAAALVIEAGKVLFFQKEKALETAARAGLAVIARR
jgi:hypothetical protein